MFDKKALVYSVIIAALIGVLVSFLATSFIPVWASASPLIKGAVTGAFCGPIYPILAGRSRA